MNERRKAGKYLSIYWTEKEKEEINSLFYTSKVSKQGQSELFTSFIIEGLKKHNKSLNPYTQTNQQEINDKKLKLKSLEEIKGFIKSKPMNLERCFNYFFKIYKSKFGTERTCFNWFKVLFEKGEFVLLNLDKLYILEKNSFYHSQLKEHISEFPLSRFNYQPQSYDSARRKVFEYLSNIYKNNIFDRVEEFIKDKFLLEQQGEELKPYKNDFILLDILELRSNWEHKKALDLLKKEEEIKNKKENPIDQGEAFLNSL